jgi:hypothetical protein
MGRFWLPDRTQATAGFPSGHARTRISDAPGSRKALQIRMFGGGARGGSRQPSRAGPQADHPPPVNGRLADERIRGSCVGSAYMVAQP